MKNLKNGVVDMEKTNEGKYAGLDEMLTPEDIMRHLKLGRNRTYQLIHLSGFPKIKIGNTYRIPKIQYIKWIENNVNKKVFL